MKNEEFCYQNEKNIPGEMDWIEIDLLIIPAKDEKRTACTKDFQRVEVSRKKTREMAEKWDWALCQTISVAEIQGKFHVIDGGNRVRAARLNGKIEKLPCVVFHGMTEVDAAKAFTGIAELKTNLKTYERHNAAIVSGDPTAKTVD